MKELKDMTAAELVGKLNDCENELKMGAWETPERVAYRKQIKDFMETLTAELDARCERAGIMIDPEGYPVFFNFDHCQHFSAPKPELYASAEFLPPPQPVARVNVKAEDVRDLLSYLLTKGGAK